VPSSTSLFQKEFDMTKNVFTKDFFILVCFTFVSVLVCAAQESGPSTGLLDFAKSSIEEKSKATGHLDLFDEKINKVRNLDLMEMNPTVEKKDNLDVVSGKFRDVASGDIVTLHISIEEKDGAKSVKDITIGEISAATVAAAADPNHEFTDQEIQDVMKKYLDKKSQFTGSFDIFDEKLQALRNLKVGAFEPSVRRFGTRFISRVETTDMKSAETVLLDLSVDNNAGNLEVKNVKIFQVKKNQ
jgi:hypothetical protein